MTGLVWGILIGGLLLLVIVSYRIDQNYKKTVYLENIIINKDAKLKQRENIKNTQYIILEDIEIYLDFIGEDLDEIEIEKQ